MVSKGFPLLPLVSWNLVWFSPESPNKRMKSKNWSFLTTHHYIFIGVLKSEVWIILVQFFRSRGVIVFCSNSLNYNDPQLTGYYNRVLRIHPSTINHIHKFHKKISSSTQKTENHPKMSKKRYSPHSPLQALHCSTALLALRHSDRRVAAMLLPQLGDAHRLPEVVEAGVAGEIHEMVKSMKSMVT